MLENPEVARYREDGYLARVEVAAPDEAAEFRRKFDEVESREGRDRSEVGLIDHHFTERFIWDLATHPIILDAIESLIGPDVILLATHFFCKYGPRPHFVAWHQDVTYWGLEPPEAVTAWYAIDDSDRGNGCMRVIPGTHGEIRTHGTSHADGNLLSINQEVPVSEEEEERAVDLELKSGEISIHDGTLIHGSLPNHSSRRRCGLTLRYTAPHVKQISDNSHGGTWSAILVRGTDRFHHFDTAEPPFPISSREE